MIFTDKVQNSITNLLEKFKKLPLVDEGDWVEDDEEWVELDEEDS